MLKKPPRRTHRDDSQGLMLTSWAGLSEYLLYSKDDIIRIVYAPANKRRLEALLQKNDVNCSLEESSEEPGLSVFVKVPSVEEGDFLNEMKDQEVAFILACDHITDTRNLGAIARSAAYFGIRYLLLPKDRQAPITNATLGAAQGAFASLRPVFVTNLGRTLKALQEMGFWVLCADMSGPPVEALSHNYEKKVLVFGAEDKGVSQGIRNKCDITVSISSEAAKVESLNVSVAAGILIHALHKHSTQSKKNS